MNDSDAAAAASSCRITLERVAARHAALIYPILADAAVWTFTDGGMPESCAALRARYARLERRRSPGGDEHWLNWIVCDATSGAAIGFVQATIPTGSTTASIAYVIGRQYWGRGFATEAVRLMVGELRQEFGITSLTATVDCRNVASIAVLERLGLRCLDAADPQRRRYAGPVVR